MKILNYLLSIFQKSPSWPMPEAGERSAVVAKMMKEYKRNQLKKEQADDEPVG